ncbi:MAG: hypothetical protein R6U96_17095 [Promethearchaeia archaeon]
MKKKKYCIILAISVSLLLGISFFLVPQAHAESQVPSDYSEDLSLNKTYIYNVTGFDSVLYFYDYHYNSIANVSSNDGGQIWINFTGFYDKDSADMNTFSEPVPYLNISFWKKESNSMVLNDTISNVSSSLAGYDLAMAFNDFRPGFLIPTEDTDSVIQKAEDEELGYINGTVETQEFKYLSMLDITFKANNTSQNTTLIYDTETGILEYCEVESTLGPNFGLELHEIKDLGYEEPAISGFSVIFLLLSIAVCSGIILLRLRKRRKKYQS